ncbi:MAG TPA: uroporphyrinogen-III synthase [Chitinophagaceae bacterium]|nr:uroporphyrinogen-III synthase [Chitinophagaceae bacterium]
MKYKVLSTKKLEPSMIEQAKQNDIEVIEQEFIAVKPIFSEEKFKQIIEWVRAGIQHIVFTSSNAIDILEQYFTTENRPDFSDCKIFCLSGKTRVAILNTGFSEKNIVGQADNASDLAKKIIAQKTEEVIFFCGNKRRDELPSILKEAGVIVHEIAVYETLETPKVVTDDFDAILFFSPSAVQSFFSVNQLKKTTICFAIGKTTAENITNFTSNRIITSEFPSQEMLIASVQNYFQNINCYE